MKEKSEMKSHLAANVCKIEQSVPSRSVESENVLNSLSLTPGRNSRWILPAELETPTRPTSSGLQSPVGAPYSLVQVHRLESMFDLLHVAYLQLNGEMSMPEKEMMNVNCAELDDQDFLANPSQGVGH